MLGHPFSGPLARENRLLLVFFCLYCCHFQVVGFFNSKPGIYEAKENPRNSPSCLFLGHKSLAGLPSYICFTCNVQGFLVALSGRNKEKYIYSLFPETEVLLVIFNQLLQWELEPCTHVPIY